MRNNKSIDMKNRNIIILLTSLTVLMLASPTTLLGQEKLPVREYTNPDEVVTFDRTTAFTRALDVINDFAQEARGKVIIDRTGQSGSIGITVPPMHWEDALDLILRVKGLVLFEREKFYEILSAQQTGATASGQQTTQQGGEEGEGPPATLRSREVRINAIFFEGNKRALQEIGVDWSTLTENVPEEIGSFANPQQGGGGGGSEGQLPSTTFEDQFVSVNSKGAQNVSQSVFNSIVNFGEIGNSGIRVQALFSAFEADNLGEILASPTVKVLDGQEGRVQVGQDFSIKQRDFAGNVTDQFFSVGTILQVTPQIIEQQDTTFIHLTIEAERSSAQPDPVSTVINKQEATTQSVLVNGESTVIAGLYRTESAEVRRGIPVLKDLPPWLFGLRYLFGYNSKDYQMRELVILIQASIEPSIPERYAQKEYKSKYEVLEDERQRIRDEMRESAVDTEELVGEEPEMQEEPPAEEPESSEEAQDQQMMQEEEPTAENASEPEEQEEMQQEPPAPLTTDPEVKTQPVALNFGSEDNEEENNAEEQSTEPTTMQSTDDSKDSEPNSGGSAMANASSSSTLSGGQAAKDDMEQESSSSTTVTAEADPGDDTTQQEKEESMGQSGSSSFNYYIVAGSFKNEDNALEYKEKLAGEDYPAVILNKPDSDFFFVAYNRFGDLDQAKMALTDIVENKNANAWIYRGN